MTLNNVPKKIAFLLITLAGGALLQAAPYSYSESTQGFYVSATGGLGLASDPDLGLSIPAVPIDASGETDTDLGFGASAAFGYEINHFRFELEYSYRQNDGEIAGFPVGPLNPDGVTHDLSFHNLMLNVLYDFYLTDTVYWYNGGGIGVAFVKGDVEGTTTNGTTVSGDDRSAAFAWQLMTGFGYDITQNVALTLGYRIYSTSSADLNFDLPNIPNADVDADVDTPFINAFELGVRYNF